METRELIIIASIGSGVCAILIIAAVSFLVYRFRCSRGDSTRPGRKSTNTNLALVEHLYQNTGGTISQKTESSDRVRAAGHDPNINKQTTVDCDQGNNTESVNTNNAQNGASGSSQENDISNLLNIQREQNPQVSLHIYDSTNNPGSHINTVHIENDSCVDTKTRDIGPKGENLNLDASLLYGYTRRILKESERDRLNTNKPTSSADNVNAVHDFYLTPRLNSVNSTGLKSSFNNGTHVENSLSEGTHHSSTTKGKKIGNDDDEKDNLHTNTYLVANEHHLRTHASKMMNLRGENPEMKDSSTEKIRRTDMLQQNDLFDKSELLQKLEQMKEKKQNGISNTNDNTDNHNEISRETKRAHLQLNSMPQSAFNRDVMQKYEGGVSSDVEEGLSAALNRRNKNFDDRERKKVENCTYDNATGDSKRRDNGACNEPQSELSAALQRRQQKNDTVDSAKKDLKINSNIIKGKNDEEDMCGDTCVTKKADNSASSGHKEEVIPETGNLPVSKSERITQVNRPIGSETTASKTNQMDGRLSNELALLLQRRQAKIDSAEKLDAESNETHAIGKNNIQDVSAKREAATVSSNQPYKAHERTNGKSDANKDSSNCFIHRKEVRFQDEIGDSAKEDVKRNDVTTDTNTDVDFSAALKRRQANIK